MRVCTQQRLSALKVNLSKITPALQTKTLLPRSLPLHTPPSLSLACSTLQFSAFTNQEYLSTMEKDSVSEESPRGDSMLFPSGEMDTQIEQTDEV
jgi:hypothetical protein